jgi:hypothetical protein
MEYVNVTFLKTKYRLKDACFSWAFFALKSNLSQKLVIKYEHDIHVYVQLLSENLCSVLYI